MNNLALKLNPLSKLKIYRAVRQIILTKMNHNEITPQRAMEIIQYAKSNIIQVKSAQMGLSFCRQLEEKYPELKNLTHILEEQSLEQFDHVITMIIDKIMEKNDINTADELLTQMEKNATKEEKEKLMAKLQKKYPRDFEAAVASLTQLSKK